MGQLIYHKTAQAQWHRLLLDAKKQSGIDIDEDLEGYLVMLLMRFIDEPSIAHTVFANEYLSSQKLPPALAKQNLRDVADKSLLFAGLFPGQANCKHVRISYFIDIGQTAYDQLSTLTKQTLAELFAQLSCKFVTLMDLLHVACEIDKPHSYLSPLQAHELWEDTQSQHALNSLQARTSEPCQILSHHKKINS